MRESLEEDVKGEIRDFLDSFDQVKKTIISINRELEGVRISDIDYFKLEEYPINSELNSFRVCPTANDTSRWENWENGFVV